MLKIRKLIRGTNGSQTKSVRLYSPCSLLLCYAVSYCIPLIIPPSMTLLCFTNTACHLLKACVTAQTCIPAITKDSHPHRQQMGAGTLGATVTTSRSVSNRLPGPVVVICFLLLLCANRKLGVGEKRRGGGRGREERRGGGGEPTRKKTKTKRRSHWKMGESTYWYQPELLGTVPSLAAKELWNIFVRAGFLYSPLQTFSDCALTKRPTL